MFIRLNAERLCQRDDQPCPETRHCFECPRERDPLKEPVSNIQALLWSLMMEIKYGNRDWLELLDETVDTLHDDYILYSFADKEVKES